MTSTPVPIRASDKLQTLFDRDERLIDVLAGLSPKLAKLRTSPMRRVMAPLTTVAQAAQICKVTPEALLRDLNRVLGIEAEEQAAAVSEEAATTATEGPARPAFSAEILLDVREQLASGGEPFSKIMSAVAGLHDGEALHLRAPFEPAPLLSVMGKRGFLHSTERHADDDWSVWFYRGSGKPESQTHTETRSDAAPVTSGVPHAVGARDETWLDVRGLEPPEPMVHTLEALESLPSGNTLVQLNSRIPQFLLPILRERGFHYSIEEVPPDEVHVRIWRNT